MIALHPEATDDPALIRWVADVDLPVGRVTACPLRDPAIAEIVTECGAVWIRLVDARWPQLGAQIRSDLAEALTRPDEWEIVDDPGVVELVARDVLGGPLNTYAASHGGGISLVGADPHTVTVATTGACHGCPVSKLTLTGRLGGEMEKRLGRAVEVVERD